MYKKILLLTMVIGIAWISSGQVRKIEGTVLSKDGHPVIGALVAPEKGNQKTLTDSFGHFIVVSSPNDTGLIISHNGYVSQKISIHRHGTPLLVVLESEAATLEDIVVSTGYQTLSKEKTIGAYTTINNNLLNRSISTDIISRLENVASGLQFDRRYNGTPSLIVRGQSTIQSNAAPLIIVDNFPYEGDINHINPNDIENVTILKDAAAASIWGARAGNGVIVITTKKGQAEHAPQIQLNSNLTIGTKPDLYYSRQFLNASDFIDVEKTLFTSGYYSSLESNPTHPVLSPVVELLIGERDGTVNSIDAEKAISSYRTQDVRKDFSKYFYQNSTNQQYALSLKGGSSTISYYLSGGYDRNSDNLKRNGLKRITANSMLKYHPIANLDITSNIVYSTSKQTMNNVGIDQISSGGGKNIYPYARLADENGKPLAIARDYNAAFIDQAKPNGLLDWFYKPLEDMRNAEYTVNTEDVRINTAAKYYINSFLDIEGRYQYEHQNSNSRNLQTEELYYTRNLINQYASVNADGTINFPIPKGSILDNNNTEITAHAARVQANFHKDWGQNNQVNVLMGTEMRQTKTIGAGNRLYGYSDNLLTYSTVDYTTNYLINPDGYTARIPNGILLSYLTDRNRSYFGNAFYTLEKRYMVYASARKDESNLFGVDANQKGTPLWSAGLGWLLSSEKFYGFQRWLPLLKLRTTYGYSGNVNKSLTAYATGNYYVNTSTGLPYVQILTPPNPNLRWEKVKMINLGLDFETVNHFLYGSIEYYLKKGIDLIGTAPLDPTIGYSVGGRNEFIGNNAAMTGKGLDVQLNISKTVNKFNYTGQILYSYTKNRVTRYDYKNYITDYFSGAAPPLVGNARYGIYSLKWAGLDPATGDPQIFVKGEVTKNYSGIIASLDKTDLIYNGSALPTHFGSFRNNFRLGDFSIGFNISYKLGYYFRKTSISYSALFDNWIGNVDFNNRWKKTGDEISSQIPSMPIPGTSYVRDFVYNNSNILVEKGDHIRIQDINLSYDLTKSHQSWLPFKKVTIYGYINNLGIIWRANKEKIDPDYIYQPYPPTKTYSLGINFLF